MSIGCLSGRSRTGAKIAHYLPSSCSLSATKVASLDFTRSGALHRYLSQNPGCVRNRGAAGFGEHIVYCHLSSAWPDAHAIDLEAVHLMILTRSQVELPCIGQTYLLDSLHNISGHDRHSNATTKAMISDIAIPTIRVLLEMHSVSTTVLLQMVLSHLRVSFRSTRQG